MERVCNICQNIYKPINKQSLFCSIECKRLGRNKRLRAKTQEKRQRIQCIECNIDFIQDHASRTKFCTPRCKQIIIIRKPKKKEKQLRRNLNFL